MPQVRKIQEDDVPKLYKRWLLGESLRSIAKSLKFDHTTLYERFKRTYGDELSKYKYNVYRLIKKDYLDNPKFSKKDKLEILNWMETLHISQVEANLKLFTNKDLHNNTKNTVGYSQDFRSILNFADIQESQLIGNL